MWSWIVYLNALWGGGEGYVTAFFARLQFTSILLWCSEHHHHHHHQGQKFTSFCNYSVLPSLNTVYYYYYYFYYHHHFITRFCTSQSLLIGLAALGNSGKVMGNSSVRIDVSMEISARQFHLKKIGHSEDVASPWATAICPWIKWVV